MESIRQKIRQFKRKYYLRQLVKGSLITLLAFISLFLVAILLENSFWFPSSVRLILLISLVLIFLVPLVSLVFVPILQLLNLSKSLSDIRASKEIGKFFPEISDKLVNYLQISELKQQDSSLIAAAIDQKTKELNVFQFHNAVDFSIIKKYLYSFVGLVSILFLLSFINTSAVTESSKRIVLYDQQFKKKAPFEFILENNDLSVFRNESFDLRVRVAGKSLPEDIYLSLENRRIKLNKQREDVFGFKLTSVNNPITFQLEASGYQSESFKIRLLDRPELRDFSINLDYPGYTKLEDESINNSGNLMIPEGTSIEWNLNTSNTESVKLRIGEELNEFIKDTENSSHSLEKRAYADFKYNLELENEYGSNRSEIEYQVKVIKDEFPQITLEYLPDTILYQTILLSGDIHDDYGVSKMTLSYRKMYDESFKKVQLLSQVDAADREFFFNWPVDTMSLDKTQTLEFYISVLDNDAINGSKESRSKKYFFQKPDMQAIKDMIAEKSQQSEEKLDKAQSDAQSLNDKLEELEERLKTKNKMEWQEEKMAEDILKEREELEKTIEELKKQFDNLKKSKEEFLEQNQNIQEKTKQLQSLMNELLDEKTKQLYDELKKLLEEKANSDQVRDQLDRLQVNEKNLENELERALELFKRLKLESKLDESIKDLEALAERQEALAEKEPSETEPHESIGEDQDSQNDDSANNAEQDSDQKEDGIEDENRRNKNQANKQEEIKKDFENIEDGLQEIEQINQELKKPEPLQEFQEDEKQIKKNLEELSEEMKNDQKPSKGTKSKQKQTGQQMKELAKKLEKMQTSMQMETMQENVDNLRNILDNLVKLSFDQEEIIQNFRKVRQSDPRFIDLSQEQLQLIDNAQVIEDSLFSLSERVFQISSFITREIGAINDNLSSAMFELRERNKGKAMSHQQFAMTSVNNLALLLSDVLEQMQNAMSMANGDQSQEPSMGELQKQLSQQIEDLKKSGKSGRELSEELARMAAEQEMIRQQMKALQEKLSGQPNGEKLGNDLSEIMKEMEESEMDLVNKQLTQRLIERQKRLVTRMLEAEESMREQKIDPERDGETADKYQRKAPPAYEEYLKARQSELELLRTIPIELSPFYKKEVNDYFRRLSEGQ